MQWKNHTENQLQMLIVQISRVDFVQLFQSITTLSFREIVNNRFAQY